MKPTSILLLFILFFAVGCQSVRPATRRDIALRERAIEGLLSSSPKAVAWVKEHRREIVQTALSVAVVAANLDR